MTLHLHNIYKKFSDGQNDIELFNGLNITLPCYGMIGIVGSSGTGKSTLLHIIAGLVKLDQGEMVYNALSAFKNETQREDYIKNNISHLYQYYNLIDYLTVRENIEYGCYCKKHTIEHREKIFQFAKKLEIDSILDYYPSQLSGGQSQRVALLRAFMCDMPILLCDEPTGALHKKQSIEVMNLLKQYATNHLVVVVSHDEDLLKQYTHKIIHLNEKEKSYHFMTNTYPQYSKEKQKHSYIKQSFYYCFKQLMQKKKAMLSLFVFQIIMIVSFLTIVSGTYGLQFYYDSLKEKDVSKHQIIVQKEDYKNFEMSEEDLLLLTDHFGGVYNYYAFEMGTINDLSTHFVQVIGDSNHINVLDGAISNKVNEICINASLATKGYAIGDDLQYQYDEQMYTFYITGIIDDDLLQQDIIYSKPISIDTTLKKELLSTNYKIIHIENEEIETVLEQLNSLGFIGFSFNYEMVNSLQSMVTMTALISCIFMTISFLISMILAHIVFSTLLFQRRKNIAISMSYGLSYKEIKKQYFIEGCMVGFGIAFCGYIIGCLWVKLLNVFEVYSLLLDVNCMFRLNYGFTFLFLCISYTLTCGYVAKEVSKGINKLEITSLLKED